MFFPLALLSLLLTQGCGGAKPIDYFNIMFKLNLVPPRDWVDGLENWSRIIDPCANSKPLYITGSAGQPRLSVSGDTLTMHDITEESKKQATERAMQMISYTNGWYRNEVLPKQEQEKKKIEADKLRIEEARKRLIE